MPTAASRQRSIAAVSLSLAPSPACLCAPFPAQALCALHQGGVLSAGELCRRKQGAVRQAPAHNEGEAAGLWELLGSFLQLQPARQIQQPHRLACIAAAQDSSWHVHSRSPAPACYATTAAERSRSSALFLTSAAPVQALKQAMYASAIARSSSPLQTECSLPHAELHFMHTDFLPSMLPTPPLVLICRG